MNEDQTIQLLQTAAGIFALAALWNLCWRRYALDKFRQELFATRDRLFDVALKNQDGEFSFKAPAYRQLRRQIHASIRFAHRVSMLQVLIFMFFRFCFFRYILVPDRNVDRAKMLDGADDAVQAEVMSILCDWDGAVIGFMRRTSPLYYVTWVFLFVKLITEMILQNRKTAPEEATPQKADSQVSAVVWADVALADAASETEQECRLVLAQGVI